LYRYKDSRALKDLAYKRSKYREDRDKSEIVSRNHNNRKFLGSIKEDQYYENSTSSFLMDKPIRSLQDIYKGICEGYEKQKEMKSNKVEKEDNDSSESSESSSEDNAEDADLEYEVEMEPNQKKILEDKVIKVIHYWKDIEYFKSESPPK
jgi:hypothetical protein